VTELRKKDFTSMKSKEERNVLNLFQ